MNSELEMLRAEMVAAFWTYITTDSGRTNHREAAWDIYCEKRELFLEFDCHLRGIKFNRLKETLVDTDNGRTYKKGPDS